jgi:hypothetical protein
MKRISIKAVFLGAVADIVASSLLGIPFGFYVVSAHRLTGLHREALRSAVVAAVQSSTLLYATQLLIGFSASVLGDMLRHTWQETKSTLMGFWRHGSASESVFAHWLPVRMAWRP